MRITPTIITDINNRVMGINDHQRQVLDGRLVPINENTVGWVAGGLFYNFNTVSLSVSTIDRITFQNDVTISQVRGPLAASVSDSASHSNSTDGWVVGGYNSNVTDVTQVTNRVIFASDASIATLRGNLSLARRGFSGSGNLTDGWFVGGSGTNTSVSVSRIDRITFAQDNNVAATRGNMPQARSTAGSHSNNTNQWFAGGLASGTRVQTTSRLTFASDTSAAVNRGTLPLTAEQVASGNITDMWVTGFFTGSTPTTNIFVDSSLVTRITFTSDTTTASTRGSLSIPSSSGAIVRNNQDMWISGGTRHSTTPFSTTSSIGSDIDDIQRITFANDTVQVPIRGKASDRMAVRVGIS